MPEPKYNCGDSQKENENPDDDKEEDWSCGCIDACFGAQTDYLDSQCLRLISLVFCQNIIFVCILYSCICIYVFMVSKKSYWGH
jgi:hypothetical protein